MGMGEEQAGDAKTACDEPNSPEASSAYLGPKLWEKPIQAKFNEDDFFVMNIDEFLKENQIALRAAFLEKENVGLRKDVEEANAALARQKMEVAILREKMARFEAGIYSQSGPK